MVILIPLRVGHNDDNFGWQYGPDQDGSIGVEFSFKNDSMRTIKAATFIFSAKTKDGQPAPCSRTGSSEFAARYTGPLLPGEIAPTMYVEHCWYNPAIVRAEVSRAELIYVGGKREILYGEQIRYEPPGGCYIATCVYGSYDCPPVWTLRRFRDSCLAQNRIGRWCIRVYYAVSPTLVRRFSRRIWFRRLCRRPLDRLVSHLMTRGISNAPYDDRQENHPS